MFRLGLVINPFAGIGGRVGLKGSDGALIRDKSLALGAIKLAESRAIVCFEQFKESFEEIEVFTASGEMGENLCLQLDLKYTSLHTSSNPSSEEDTKQATKAIQKKSLDLLLFVGGDGTARNIYEVSDEKQVTLGVPAGVKIHSGVYAVSPEAAGLLVKLLISGKMLSLTSASVVDLDEEAFRHDKVIAKHYGYLAVPESLEYVQAVKQGNQEVEELVLDDIAAEVIESMEDDVYYVIGSGTTCAAIMLQLDLANTLLGMDIILNGDVVISDANETDFLELLNSGIKLEFILTVIGGQGHILGRGNQQISPKVIMATGWEHFQIIASKSKLKGIASGRLLVDTGDIKLDHQLFGLKKIITGYRDYVLFPVGL